MHESLTFSDFISRYGGHDKQLSSLLNGMAKAAATISRSLARCVFEQRHEANGKRNAQGEWQQHMDVFAEELFLENLQKSGACCLVISEERSEVIRLGTATDINAAPYIMAIDPLDGSSNVFVNVPVGSIFSIFKRKDPKAKLYSDEALQNGDDQVAAGYFLYGHSTMLVFTDGVEVNGFTLDTATGEFILSHPNIRIPATGNIYAVNDANYHLFNRGPQNFLRYCRQQADLGDVPFTARYSGSMVSDIHRILMCGGIFLYPETLSAPLGKLRLAYECFPMAFIIETAGGIATTGVHRIMDVPLGSIHQRSPIAIGSPNLVITAERFLNPFVPFLNEFNG